MDLDQATRGLRDRTPHTLREIIAMAGDEHVATLAGGLAFFGILSIAPALAIAVGIMRTVLSAETLNVLVESLKDFQATLQLGSLIEQMQGQVYRYAGIGFLVLLWPATTLAGGWTRALDAVEDRDSPPGLRGLAGRLKGLGLGVLLLVGLLGLLGATMLGITGSRVLALVLAVAVGVLVAFAHTIVLYRWFPSGKQLPLSRLWRGAVLATVGIVLTTAVLGVLLTVAESISQRYPPSLSTAVVLGLWLYGMNASMLLGAVYNAVHNGGAD